MDGRGARGPDRLTANEGFPSPTPGMVFAPPRTSGSVRRPGGGVTSMSMISGGHVDRPAQPALGKAVFVDKDGTLVENLPHNVDPALVRFTPHAADGLRLLGKKGYRLIVVTNQPGLAYGLFTRAALT